MSKLKWIFIIVSLAVYLVLIPLLFRDASYVLHVFIVASELSIIALTVRLIFSVGELAFGQVVFVMVGAYASAILSTKVGLPFWLCLPLAGIISGIFAGLIGLPFMRLKGTYFSILTLIFVEVMKQTARSWKFLGGTRGFYDIPRPEAIYIGTFNLIPQFGVHDRLPYYFVIAFLLIITMLVFSRLEASPTGSAFRAVRQDALAKSLGINTKKYRILAFSLGALFAGLVGSFSAHYMTVFFPESFSLWDSITYVMYAFLGGIGYFWGPIVGSFALTWLWEFLSPIVQYQMLVFAGMIIGTMLFLPGGLLSLVKFLPSLGSGRRYR